MVDPYRTIPSARGQYEGIRTFAARIARLEAIRRTGQPSQQSSLMPLCYFCTTQTRSMCSSVTR